MAKPEGGPSKLYLLQPSSHLPKKWALPSDIRAALTQLFVVNLNRIFVLFFDRIYKNMDATLPTTPRPTVQELG